MLVKRNVIHEIGLLDPEYFMYWEETDWCVRAHKAGYKVFYVPKAKIWHKLSVDSGGENNQKMYYLIMNKFLFMKKNSTKSQFLFFGYFSLKEIILLTGLFILHKDLEALKRFYKATYDGIVLILRKSSIKPKIKE